MKFSYHILKQLVPGLPPIAELAEKITMHVFEVESVVGDVLDINILPNRYSDAACYWGMAREIAAICNLPQSGHKVKKPASTVIKAVPATINIANLCRRIATVYIENIHIVPSPDWLISALAASGIRSINNLVDITNYVMLETGQPLHVFDYEKIHGGKIIVRQAHEGEIVETLDSKKITLNPSVLVLADEKNALDIAGIKGGSRAEITAATKNILLTAGNFDGAVIYKTARRINLITDASIRFSHHISPALVEQGMRRALELIKELCGGKIGVITDVYPKPVQPISILYDHKKFAALTGAALPERKALSLLKQLGFTNKEKKIQPPSERTDIERFEDITEEIMRLYGYENSACEPPRIELAPAKQSALAACVGKTRQVLAIHYDEVYLSSFGSDANVIQAHANAANVYEAGAVALENPVSADRAYLRSSLAPALLRAAEDNLRFFETVRVFEIGKVFHKKVTHEPRETEMLGIVCAATKENNYAELRGTVDGLATALGITFACKEENSERLMLLINGETIGALWMVNGQTAVAELNLEKCAARASLIPVYQPPPQYPSISRDVSLRMPHVVRVGKLIETIRASAPLTLQSIDVIDAYEDSITFRLVFRNPHRTMTDKEINEVIKKITATLRQEYTITIR